MSLKILLVGNYPPDRQKSMAAFAAMMELCLTEAGISVKLLNPPARLLPVNVIPKGFWKWIAYIDKFVFFPFTLRLQSKNFDLVHICDHSNAMYALALTNIPTVTTCHDVLAIEAARDMIPDWKVGFVGKIFQRLIFNGLNRTSAVVCVSKYTKSHLKNLGWNGKNVSVALNSLNANFFPDDITIIEGTLKKIGLQVDAKYLMHVGSDLSRKNRLFILKIFKKITLACPDKNFKLLFIGPMHSIEMKQFMIDNLLTESVHFIQNVTHAMLRSLYSGAVGLVFPSLQEGFGWPIIEAQACGCPVFTSNILPMTEVGGDGAIYIDTLNENMAADGIVSALSDLKSIRQKGFDNLERFSRKNMMKSYHSAYMHVAEGE